MKKLLKRVVTYILIFILSVICVKPMNVFAYGGFFTTDSFSKTGTWTDSNNVSHAAYVMDDDTNLQTGYRYYMRVADGVAIACDGGEVITNILNYKIGLVMSASTLSNFLTSYIEDNAFTGQSPTFYDNHPPVLKGGNIVGIALNELTGCRMATADNSDVVNIPSNVSNDIYLYYTNVFLIDNPESPDFVNIGTLKTSYVIGNVINGEYKDLLAPPYGDLNFGYQKNNYTVRWNWGSTGRDNVYGFISGNDYYFVANNGYEDFVNAFNLTKDNFTVTSTQLENYRTSINLLVKAKYISSNGYKNFGSFDLAGNNLQDNAGTISSVAYRNGDNTSIPFSSTIDYFTVYKNELIVSQITNNTYSPSTYHTQNYQNYTTANDNSYTTNVQNINNSSSNNTNIYNDSKTETNETIVEDSYNVNTTTTTTNITNITNNYYGDNGSGGSGGGDDNGGDDDDDDTIWKALLKAIGDFLKKIGELIATVLTGIISILTSVLDAIASITTSFSAITDFLGAVFGFLPSDLVAVITLGVTLGILISLIKMFGK